MAFRPLTLARCTLGSTSALQYQASIRVRAVGSNGQAIIPLLVRHSVDARPEGHCYAREAQRGDLLVHSPGRFLSLLLDALSMVPFASEGGIFIGNRE